MELKDVLDRSMVRLQNVLFVNDYPIDTEEGTLEFTAGDSLGDFQKAEDEIFATYKRIFSSTDSHIKVEVTFQFRSKIKQNIQVEDQELIHAIQDQKDQFVLFAPSDASIIIANIMKSAGFPPLVTQPTFIEKESK